jgi:hypothetical protein
MTFRNFMGMLTMALAPLLVGAAGYWLFSAHYRLALIASVFVVLCMELRVRLGWRLPRKPLFVLHVLVGVTLLVCLVLLAWRPMPAWLLWVAGMLLTYIALDGGAKLVEQHVTLK